MTCSKSHSNYPETLYYNPHLPVPSPLHFLLQLISSVFISGIAVPLENIDKSGSSFLCFQPSASGTKLPLRSLICTASRSPTLPLGLQRHQTSLPHLPPCLFPFSSPWLARSFSLGPLRGLLPAACSAPPSLRLANSYSLFSIPLTCHLL